MKIVTVVGARPQFIKAATVSREIRAYNRCAERSEVLDEIILHTGQHYDANMSQVFFDQLDISPPTHNLAINGGPHGEMTGRMLEGIERILMEDPPEWVIVYGDTNSTLAGALAAIKLHIPVAHIEAGLRSFNLKMPEEINRILTDRVSTLLFCPTKRSVSNLTAEGVTKGVHQVGDVMFDASLFYRDLARKRSEILNRLKLQEREYVLATCHRVENTYNPAKLSEIVDGLHRIAYDKCVVLALHPRTRKLMAQDQLAAQLSNIEVIEPVPYLDMARLEQSAFAIVTDSGGMQKEAFFYGVPCITVREETEWFETVELGWNTLCGANSERILSAWNAVNCQRDRKRGTPYGDGHAAPKIIELLANYDCHITPGL